MEVVTVGQRKLYLRFGIRDSSSFGGQMRGLLWQPVRVDCGLVERAQDFESDGPGFRSQFCPQLGRVCSWALVGFLHEIAVRM